MPEEPIQRKGGLAVAEENYGYMECVWDNFMCQLDWTKGNPGSQLSLILEWVFEWVS